MFTIGPNPKGAPPGGKDGIPPWGNMPGCPPPPWNPGNMLGWIVRRVDRHTFAALFSVHTMFPNGGQFPAAAYQQGMLPMGAFAGMQGAQTPNVQMPGIQMQGMQGDAMSNMAAMTGMNPAALQAMYQVG